jgi:hypothetical protein
MIEPSEARAISSRELGESVRGDFYAGVDLGKHVDHSVIALVRRDEDALRLVGLKIFPLETEYPGIIGYLKVMSERLHTIHRFLSTRRVLGRVF